MLRVKKAGQIRMLLVYTHFVEDNNNILGTLEATCIGMTFGVRGIQIKEIKVTDTFIAMLQILVLISCSGFLFGIK